MKKLFSGITALALCSSVYGQSISVTDGWQLSGATEDITDLTKFDSSGCVDFVWKYNGSVSPAQWNLHIANGQDYNYSGSTISSITSGEGFWIKGNSNCTVDTTQSSSQSNSTLKTITYNELDNKTFIFNDTETLTLAFDETSHTVIIDGIDNNTMWSIHDTNMDSNGDSIGFQMDDGYTYIQFNNDGITANIIKMSGNIPDATILSQSNNLSFTSSWTYNSTLSNRYINADSGNYHLYLDNGIYFEFESGVNWFMAMGEYSTEEGPSVDNSIILHETDGSELTIDYTTLAQGANIQFEGGSLVTITQSFDNFEKEQQYSHSDTNVGNMTPTEVFSELSCSYIDQHNTSYPDYPILGISLQSNVEFCHNNGYIYKLNEQTTPYGIYYSKGDTAYFVLDLFKYYGNNPAEADKGALSVRKLTVGSNITGIDHVYNPFLP
ncbi:MAG: hypothetical protein U9N34_06190 [Candidatus Cloacimonadota bacterium]|nr:hypothetical protein [Candidatus Cloacimonadota bacterium]